MSRNQSLLVIAGAALGMGNVAMAQNSELDIDRAYAAELKADADGRTSLLQAGGSGHDGVFHIGDGSGNYRLNVGGLLQFRYQADFRDDGAPIGDDNDFTHGFNTPRAQIRFWGNVVSPDLTYRIDFDMGDAFNNGSGNGLRNAYGQYNFEGEGSGAFIRWGQFKLPILSEENTEPEYQLAVERSAANEVFSPGYSQAVMFGYEADSFSIYAAASDGVGFIGQGDTAGTLYNAGAEADIALTLRADVKLSGAWEQFKDFTSWRGSDSAFKIGGAFHWQQQGDTNPSTVANALIGGAIDSLDYYMWTIDLQYEASGWNIFAAYMGQTLDADLVGGGSPDITNQGAVVQGGVFLAEQLELFGRWDAIFADDSLGLTEDDYHFITFGMNYYFAPESHAAKFTADVVWSLTDTTSFVNINDPVTGILGNVDENEILIRLQMQLIF